ncbi:MAG: phenylalanine--tRNA ligase subunit beta [Actinomycetales bacterium]
MMRVPLSMLAELVDLPDGVTAEQVATDFARVGIEEEAIHTSGVSGPVVVGRVLSREPEKQKNGKTINWCTVDVGPEHNGPDGYRGIVCGAHNFDAGDLVVVTLPGTSLPTPQGPFVISARKTYGHLSDGMIASAQELGIGEDHSGIVVLSELGLTGEPGDDALELLGLGEQVVEVNVTPDRGYCFSLRGLGREYAHAVGATDDFRDPADVPIPVSTPDAHPVRVVDDAPIHGVPGCDRFVTRVVRGVNPAAASPAWLQRRVTQLGMRPISLAVDATNYVMMLLGQPLHAYDLGTLAADGITVRRARAGERLTTLDDVTRTLDPQDLLITDGPDGGTIIGLAGVMGGASTEIGPTTSDVLIEAAHFDPISIARTARRHKLPSEASRRFERGVDPRVAAAAAELVVRLLVEYGGGTPGPAGDLDHTRTPGMIAMDAGLAARLVGVEYSTETVVARLREIGCTVQAEGADLGVTPATWRPDLRVGADLVEEVARLEGYDEIPSILPVAPPGRGLTQGQRARTAVARTLAQAGWSEALTYPFTSQAAFDQLGLAPDDARRRAVRLANPLSDEAPLMRTLLLETLPSALRRNISRGATDVALFETGLVTRPQRLPQVADAPILGVSARPDQADLDRLDAAVPPQPWHVAGLACGRLERAGWWGPGRPVDATDAIDAALGVAASVAAPVQVRAGDEMPWHPGRCAEIVAGEDVVGYAGELHPKVCERLDLPARSIGFELDLQALLAHAVGPASASPISPQPVVKEDVALVVDESVPAEAVAQALRTGGGPLLESVRLFDVYSGEQTGAGRKSLAFALRMRAGDHTLNAEESAAVRTAAVEEATARFDAQLRT